MCKYNYRRLITENPIMKQLIFIALISLTCVGEGRSQCYVDTAKLNQAYRDLIKGKRTYEKEKAFFDAFPSSWMEFILTYQWYYPNIPNKLNYVEHIEIFESLKLIPDTTYCDKLIHLSIGGKWSGDAISYLQEVLHNVMNKKSNVFFARLSKYTKGIQLRFWQFYWSSLYRVTDGGSNRDDYPKECELLKNRMRTKYPETVKAMEIGLNYALGEITFDEVENDFPHKYFAK